MSICDPNESGQDACAPYGNDTIGHIDCATGWDDRADYGQLDAGGCDVGCVNCLDYPSEMARHGDWRDGRRWLRPMGSSRDAMGRLHDLRTDEPWPMPQEAAGEFGACYHNLTGQQCFNRPVCRRICWRGGLDRLIAPDDLGCGATGVGEPMPDWFPDVFFYGREPWPPGMYCRKFQDRNTKATGLGVSRLARLLGPSFPRFAQIPFGYFDDVETACGTNVLTPCAGQFVAPPTDCPSAFANYPDIQPPGRRHWIEESACRGMWNTLRLDASAMEISGGPPAGAQDAAELRTAALRHAATATLPGGPVGFKFDRLDHLAYGLVELWQRRFNVGILGANDCDVLSDESTIFQQLEGSGPAGERLAIRAHVLAADFVLYLVLHKIWRFRGPRLPNRLEIEPHARFLASVKIAYTVGGAMPGPDCWDLPAGVRMRYKGRGIRPPRLAEWWGYHGRLGIGGTSSYPVSSELLRDQCWTAADRLGELPIHGWPSRGKLADEPVSWPYGGAVSIRFQTRDEIGRRLHC